MTSEAVDPFSWVGETIDGKYRVEAVVGEGGFGVVYRAVHLGFDERVAVKCLRVPENLRGDNQERFYESFMAEGRLLHRLSRASSGVVQALDVGATTSPSGVWTPYIVLEWLEGRSLEDDLDLREAQELGGRSISETVALLDPVARAIATAHEQGIAHRDLKPANLFFTDVGGRTTVKVLDFGIAKVMTEAAENGSAFEETGHSLKAFTAHYGAPEQFSRRYGATGPWTDVFALALLVRRGRYRSPRARGRGRARAVRCVGRSGPPPHAFGDGRGRTGGPTEGVAQGVGGAAQGALPGRRRLLERHSHRHGGKVTVAIPVSADGTVAFDLRHRAGDVATHAGLRGDSRRREHRPTVERPATR